MFSLGVPSPVDFINPYADFEMFLTIYNNYLIIVVTVLLLLLYFIACIWAVRQDYRDKSFRIVSFLFDNYPRDRFAYLVSVWTSSRLNAGTTAHVAIKLFGDDSESRVHILTSSFYPVLRRSSDNWFLVLSPQSLGNLYLLQVWHDNYGSSPEWYCDKICVYDLKSKMEYIFPIDQWVALTLNENPEVAVLPAYIEDLQSMKKTFSEHLKYEMRERHLVTSILLRQPRSYMTRLERLTILLCCVLIAISFSVYFYLSVSHIGVDDWNTVLASRDIWLTIYILLINFIFIMVICYAFRTSAKFTYDRLPSSLVIRSQTTDGMLSRTTMKPEDLDVNELKENRNTFEYKDDDEKSCFERITRTIYSRRTQSKVSVHLPHSKPNVKVREFWYWLAWLICIAIIVLSVIYVVYWSVKVESNQSHKCIFCAFLAIGEEIFLLRPLEILLFTSLFSLGLRFIIDAATYNIKKNDLLTYRKMYDNNDHYTEVSKLRAHPMYKPLSVGDRQRYLAKKLNYIRWLNVIDFLIILLLVLSLSLIIYHMWTSQYYANQYTKRLFTLGHSKIGTIDFFDIRNTSTMEQYLAGTFIRAVYGELIYFENKNISSTIAHSQKLYDDTRKAIGIPLIRQLRVKTIPCVEMVSQERMRCIPTYSLGNEDKTNYKPRWKPVDNKIDLKEEEEYTPWQYRERSMNWFYKSLNSFGGMRRELSYGGYLAYLTPNRFESIVRVTELTEQSWLDRLTRAVIIDITVYNVKRNMFSHITMFVEYSGVIETFNRVQVFTVPGNKSLHFSDLTLIIIIAYLAIRTVRNIDKYGMFNYLSSKENILQAIIVLLSSIGTLLLFLHFTDARSHFTESKSTSLMEHFNFDEFVYYYRAARIFMISLFVAAVIQVLFLFKAGRFINCCYMAFVLNLRNTVILVIIIVVLTKAQWMFIAYLLHIGIYYSTIEVITDRFCKSEHFESRHFLERVTISIIFTRVCFGMTMFMLIILYQKYVKIARAIVTDSENVLTFILSEIKEFMSCKSKKNKRAI